MEESEVHGYETFSMYGFSIEYPDTWDVELNPKADRTAGDVVFKTPHHHIFITWGPLEKMERKYGSLDKHAEASLRKIRRGSDVRKLDILEHKEIHVNAHKAIYNRSRATLAVGLFGMKKAYRELSTVHLYCEETARFFILYESAMILKPTMESIFQHMKDTFRCHYSNHSHRILKDDSKSDILHVYEKFSMYKFELQYPNTWRIEFNPKSARDRGYVIFSSPRNGKVFLTWGKIESVRDKYATLEDQVEAGFKRIRNNRDVRKLEIVETKKIKVNGHKAIFNNFLIETIGTFIIAVNLVNRKAFLSIDLYCDKTGRFFTLYTSSKDPSTFHEQNVIFNHMKDSFICH